MKPCIHLIYLIIFVALGSGCTLWQYADNVKIVGLHGGGAQAKRVARLNDQSCTIGASELFKGKPTKSRLEAAMDGAVAGNKIVYFRYVTSEHSQTGGFFYDDCIMFMGDGYR